MPLKMHVTFKNTDNDLVCFMEWREAEERIAVTSIQDEVILKKLIDRAETLGLIEFGQKPISADLMRALISIPWHTLTSELQNAIQRELDRLFAMVYVRTHAPYLAEHVQIKLFLAQDWNEGEHPILDDEIKLFSVDHNNPRPR